MKSPCRTTLANASPISVAIVRYWAARSTKGTGNAANSLDVRMDIVAAFHAHLQSSVLDGTVHRLEHPHDVSAFDPAADGPLPRSHAFQEVTALTLQWLDHLDSGADDVAISNLEAKVPVVHRLRLDRSHALLEHPNLLLSIQIVEHDSSLARHDDDLTSLVRIRPAHVDMSENVVGVPQGDESDVVAAVAQDLAPHRADPFRRAVEKIVENRDVMWGEIPQRVDVVADGAQVGPARVEIVDPAPVFLDVLLDLSNARVEHKRVADHQDARVRLGQIDEPLGVGRRGGDRLFDQHMLVGVQQSPRHAVVRGGFCADDDRLDARLRCRLVEIPCHVYARESSCDVQPSLEAPIAGRSDVAL